MRARRFRFSKNRNEFILCRGTLRTLVAAYLGKKPAELSFSYSPEGKPSLALAGAPTSLSFNVSHTDGMALFAFTLGRRIGVDVERVREDFASASIAERFFSRTEQRALQELPGELQQVAFFRCWTRKEAFVKAKGGGLFHALDQFDVSIVPDEQRALRATRPDPEEVKTWEIRSLKMRPPYVAALAIETMFSSTKSLSAQ